METQVADLPSLVGFPLRVKLNTDGCSKANPGLASGGGLLRDEDGEWIKGFAYNIGICHD